MPCSLHTSREMSRPRVQQHCARSQYGREEFPFTSDNVKSPRHISLLVYPMCTTASIRKSEEKSPISSLPHSMWTRIDHWRTTGKKKLQALQNNLEVYYTWTSSWIMAVGTQVGVTHLAACWANEKTASCIAEVTKLHVNVEEMTSYPIK